MHLNFVGPKIEIFHDFWIFVLNSTPKSKNAKVRENVKSWKFYKNASTLKYENVVSKTVETLFKWHQIHNNSLMLFK